MKNIKICFGKEIHMTKSNVDYPELLQFIKNSFKKQPSQMQLYYKDQDGDNITISCDEDLKAMVETCQATGKIFIDEEVELSEKSAQEYQQIMSSNIDMISSTLSKALTNQSMIQKVEENIRSFDEKQNASLEKTQESTQQQQKQQQQEQSELKEIISQTSCQVCTFLNDKNKLFCQVCSEPLPQQEQQIKEEKQDEKQEEKQEIQTKEEKSETEEKPVKKLQKAQKVKCAKKKLGKKILDVCAQIGEKSGDRQLRQLVRQEFRSFMPQIIESVKSKLPEQPQQQQQKEEKENKKEENKNPEQKAVVHKYIICDGCEKTYITGIRYKCAVCEDFDFCEKCEASKEHNHPFLKIRKPELAPKMIFCALKDDEENVFHPFQKIREACKLRKPWACRRASKSPKKEQQKQEKTSENVHKHVFEELLAHVSDVSKDLFGKKVEKKSEEKKKETQKSEEKKKVETKQEKLAKQVAVVLGGDFSQYLDLVSIYANKDINELVRIAMDERDAALKFSQNVSQKSETKGKVEESQKQEEKKEKVQEKKLKKVYSNNCYKKATTISEILGGEPQDFLGVADQFFFQSPEEIIEMILDDSSLVEKYSSY